MTTDETAALRKGEINEEEQAPAAESAKRLGACDCVRGKKPGGVTTPLS